MRPDTPAEHIAEAERLIRTATRYPEDQEPLLLQAAPTSNWPTHATGRARSTTNSSPANRPTRTS